MRKFLTLTVLALAACSQPEAAMPSMSWQVDEPASSLTFVSVKNGDIDEEHTLTGLSGAMSEDGDVRIELDMTTVETFIPIRNERIAEHLFETLTYPVAQVTAELDYGALAAMERVGEHMDTQIDFQLVLRDVALDLTGEVRVSWLETGRVRVETLAPVMVDADALDLTEGINTLRTLAGLDTIATRVPVEFIVEFTR